MTAITRNFPVQAAAAQDVSPQLAAYSGPPLAYGVWASTWRPRGYAISIPSVTIDGGAHAATRHPLFERLWWDQVHIIPASFALGFVVSETTKPFEVFNNFRRAVTLTGIAFQSGAGIAVDTGPLPVAAFASTASYNYRLRATSAGAPVIDDAVAFGFGSYAAQAPITGTRLIAFSISPDWADGVTEGVAYLTDVMAAYDTTEQRSQLRKRPRRTIRFTAMAEEARDAALLHAILYGGQPRVYGVPLWQDIGPPTADIAAGVTTIQVDTTGRQYEAGGLVFVWRNPHEWEAFQVVSFTSTTVTLASATQSAWTRASGAWVMPMRAGRLTPGETLARLSQRVSQARLVFTVDGVAL